MVVNSSSPPILQGTRVLPPMETKVQAKTPATPAKSRSNRQVTSGRFATLNSFIDFTMGQLPRSYIAVWFILYRDTRNGIARTSQNDIAQRAGVSTRTVRTAIRKLQSLGLLSVVHQGGLNRGTSSYRVSPLIQQ